ncbi:galactose-1-phosphate uridylyltransferase [Patescibacteria group bacterium]|nr:galactose-1-phosphate uridylyltransferase [Patescibacteria group bacterium]MBU4458456.1 galactose-1-phosphate uridylyltransferase [Patescibacteria group bacterium]MCG2695986.1 galactose-1-phosphate uridylyltransferase [Candidatus Portnoybacteria bacterium]
MKKNNSQYISELRQDPVSGDWMIVATGRAKKPNSFIGGRQKFEQKISDCPFENPQITGHSEPLLIYGKGNKWSLQVIKNKFPIIGYGQCPISHKEGPYTVMEGVGFHEIVITRDHKKHLALMPVEKVAEVLKAYQERYIALMDHQCVNYVFIFHNHGKEAGASISHPHSQIIALTVLPSDVKRSLSGAKRYYKEHHKCVHCEMLKCEKKEKNRCVFHNEHFVVFSPFVPRVNFELRIYPRKHQSNFKEITEAERMSLGEALQQALYRLYKGLKDPAYNFFIHTAPCDGRDYKYYHWHIEILPKTNTWAGIELGTGVEIISVKPEEVAKFLRGVKID